MSTNASSIYKAWASVPDLEPDVQARIFDWAARHEVPEVMIALAHRSDLSDEVDEQLAARNELDVLLAWASHNKGKSQERLVARLLKDKRATLLLEIAGRQDIEEEVLRAVGSASKSSIKVAWALLMNPSVPQDMVMPLVDLIAPRLTRIDGSVRNPVRDLIALRPSVGARLVQLAPSLAVAGVVSRSKEVTDEAKIAIASRYASNMRPAFNEYSIAGDFTDFAGRELPKEAIEILVGITFPDMSGSAGYNVNRIKEAVRQIETRATLDKEAILATVTESTSMDSLVANFGTAQKAFKDSGVPEESAINAMWANPHAPIWLMASTARGAATVNKREALLRLETEGDVAGIVTLFDNAFHQYEFEWFADQPAMVAAVLRLVGQAPHWIKRSAAYRSDAGLALMHERASVVLMDTGLSSLAFAKVEQRLSTREHWETFDALVSEFHGTLDELLDTVIHV